jgi:type IV secretion system protein VirB10
MKNNKVLAVCLLLSLTGMPALCKSNFSVISETTQNSQNQYATQYTEVPYTQTTTTNASTPLQGYVVAVPAGVNVQVTTTSLWGSDNMTLGQAVSAVLANDFVYNDVVIAPAGSTVAGNVTLVKKGGHAGKNGQLQIRFTQITTPYGNVIPISAMIKTDDGTGILKAATASDSAKKYAKNTAIATAAGALFGTAIGAIAGGKNGVGKGAIYGTAIGGGLGLTKSAWDKGQSIEIPANSKIELTIDQPITVHASN